MDIRSPWRLGGKESACSAGGSGLIAGLGSSPGVGNGNPLQYSWWRNPVERGAWWATVHEVAKRVKQAWATKQQYKDIYFQLQSGSNNIFLIFIPKSGKVPDI